MTLSQIIFELRRLRARVEEILRRLNKPKATTSTSTTTTGLVEVILIADGGSAQPNNPYTYTCIDADNATVYGTGIPVYSIGTRIFELTTIATAATDGIGRVLPNGQFRLLVAWERHDIVECDSIV